MRINHKLTVYVLVTMLSAACMVGLFTPANATEIWTDITLPYTITESGNYRITESYIGTEEALSINASNVIVDGQNYLLNQTDDENARFSIFISENSTNVLLKNINQTTSDIGLASLSGNFTVKDSTFKNNTGSGIIAFNVTDFTIQRCTITNSSTGITSIYASNFTITDTTISNTTDAAEMNDCDNFSIKNSQFSDGHDGLLTESRGNVNVINSTFTGFHDRAISCFGGNLTLSNCTLNENDAGIEIYSCTATVSQCNISNNYQIGLISFSSNTALNNSNINYNGDGIYLIENNDTRITNCNIKNNYYAGIMSEQCNSTLISNTVVSDSVTGILAIDYEFTSKSEFIVDSSVIQNNSYYGLGNEGIGNLVVKNSAFNYNGFGFPYYYYSPINGALITIDSNSTVTGNTFRNNSFAFMWATIFDDVTGSQVYNGNNFQNNNYTMLIAYPGNMTSQTFSFFNNLVNDTEYINPLTFSDFVDYNSDLPYYAPPPEIFSLNTTMHAGARIYGMGSTIGGNYWSHPNGTGPSQIGTDADKDGFIDTPVELFGNATYGTAYDYLAYSSSDAVRIVFMCGDNQQLSTSEASDVITVKVEDLYGPVVTGVTLNLFSSTTTGHFYSDSACTKEISGVSIPVNASTASFYFKDSAHGTPTLIVSGQNITLATTIFRVISSSTSSTSTSNPTPSPTATPTSTPTPNIIQADREDHTTASIPINGNMTASQFSNITIISNQTASITTVSFTITGESGSSGFCNLTIAKSEIPYGTTIVIYIDNQPALNQGYNEDSENYYVWFTTNYSIHEITIQFTTQQTTKGDLPLLWIGLAAVAIILVVLVALLLYRRSKHRW